MTLLCLVTSLDFVFKLIESYGNQNSLNFEQGCATCSPRKKLQINTFFSEINTFKITFIQNFSNFTCVDQICYGEWFESIARLLQKC